MSGQSCPSLFACSSQILLYRMLHCWQDNGNMCAQRKNRAGTRDDRIVDFHYPILTCFRKMITVSDPNPVLVEIILSVSENYPKVYCDAQHIFCAVPILPC